MAGKASPDEEVRSEEAWFTDERTGGNLKAF